MLFTKSRRVRSRVAIALRLAARSLHHAKDYMGEFFRRICRKLGKPQAITATAHKLARIVYHLLSTREAYNESLFHKSEEEALKRAEMRLRRHAAHLGFHIISAEEGRSFLGSRHCNWNLMTCRWWGLPAGFLGTEATITRPPGNGGFKVHPIGKARPQGARNEREIAASDTGDALPLSTGSTRMRFPSTCRKYEEWPNQTRTLSAGERCHKSRRTGAKVRTVQRSVSPVTPMTNEHTMQI